MPTLEWIGKDKVVNHHMEVPYRLLEQRYTYNGETCENSIIRGDNPKTLKSLLPRYEGKSSVSIVSDLDILPGHYR